MLQQLIPLLLLIPILGFVGTLLIPRKFERIVFSVAISAISLELVLFLTVAYQWLGTGASPVAASLGALYASQDYTLSLDLYFDWLGAVYLGITSIMAILVFIFSRYYLHREQGFKRFYCTVLLFFTGLSLIILAGNFEVLFMGWELIGISSVLLIAFYRDRFLPAKNALKVFSIYRIADAFLLAAIWYAHHIFEKSIHFADFSEVIAHHGNELTLFGLLLLMVALIKSAQFPFSYWLPRAMEGPTTSSAIFYGALSVHMGLFLLIRTFPLWEGSVGLRIAIGLFGLITAIVATSIARTQSSIKTQIAYASITQIGIMFIELALGLHWLALIHFVCNASLRTYQLLISPSVVSYLIHDQFFYFVPPAQKIKNNLLGRLRATVYILSIKEWNMNTVISHYIWKPLKSIGKAYAFLDKPLVQAASIAVVLIAMAATAVATAPTDTDTVISTSAVIVSCIFYIRAYTTKNSAQIAWNLIMLGQLFGTLFLVSASVWNWTYIAMYGVGIVAAFIAGHVCLWHLGTKGESTTLRTYHGSAYVFPRLGNLFFILCLFFISFPISSSFVAQDILLSLIPVGHAFQIILFCFSYLLIGVSTMRLYIKLFFGPHTTSHHEMAYKSS